MIWIPLGFIAAVSVVTWYFNERTEDEKHRTNKLYRERDDIYRGYDRAAAREDNQYYQQQKEGALKWREKLLFALSENNNKISSIAEGLDELHKVIQIEIIADSTSPYRRSALQQDYCRIEDAKCRLDAYREYLVYERKQIEDCLETESYADLLNIGPSDALLPAEWMYPGKLVLLSQAEINTKLAQFGHKVSFGKDFAQHQALALPYGNDIPVLITKKHAKYENLFYGCVARGILYFENIIQQKPVEMQVIQSNKNKGFVSGSLYNELIRVELPIEKLTHKHILPIVGQKIMVYPDTFNLTLDRNPLKNEPRNRVIGVSELLLSQMGEEHYQSIYISTLDSLLDNILEQDFYSLSSQWQLIDYDIKNNKIILGKSKVRIVCTINKDVDGLTVDQLIQTDQIQSGMTIPFDLFLVTDKLNLDVTEVAWKPAVEAFLQFAMQMTLNQEHAQRRQEQAQFMRQWQQVLDYQLEKESTRSIEFQSSPQLTSCRVSTLTLTKLQQQNHSGDEENTFLDFYHEVVRSDYLRDEYCFKLEQWSPERGRFLPAIAKKYSQKIKYFLNESDGLEITAQFDEYSISDFFRFKIQLPNTPLQRQHQALESFFHDRMVEPALKDILLSPKSYQPVQDFFWGNTTIEWKNKKLAPSQKNAIDKALKAKHLALIQGPPGTGKTTAIVEMLYQLFTATPDCKILMVSQQNTAVDNALGKFIKTYPDLASNSVKIIRIGNKDKVRDGLQDFHFDVTYSNFINNIQDKVQTNALNNIDGLSDLSFAWLTLLRQIGDPKGKRLDSPTADEFNTVLLSDKNLVGATCVGLANRKGGVDNLEFDIAIIDEAGRATVPELLIPLLRCHKAILIGDHFQLPPSISPILREDNAKEELPFIKELFLETSFFELLFTDLPDGCKAMLEEQYRMAPEIGDLVAELFYTNAKCRKLHNGYGDYFDKSRFVWDRSLYWINVTGAQSTPSRSTSLANDKEVNAIVGFLKRLTEQTCETMEVAIITPYGAQKNRIRDQLKNIAKEAEGATFKLGSLEIKVDTVDSFQGSEADIVCYSTVRTRGSLTFLLDKKRLNVACSRAKNHLVFFGDMKFLRDSKPRKGETNFFKKIILRAEVQM